MSKPERETIIKFLIAFMILSLLISVKTLVIINLENLGFSAQDAIASREKWELLKIDYFYVIISLIISVLVSLKVNIKSD